MTYLNRIQLIGRLGYAEEVWDFRPEKYCLLGIYTGHSYGPVDGPKDQSWDWHRGLVYPEHLKTGDQLKVGDALYAEGDIRHIEYRTDGETPHTIAVIYLDFAVVIDAPRSQSDLQTIPEPDSYHLELNRHLSKHLSQDSTYKNSDRESEIDFPFCKQLFQRHFGNQLVMETPQGTVG